MTALQLFSLDLETGEETELQDFRFEETKIEVMDSGEYHPKYNCVFSKNLEKNDETLLEDEFLRKQYIAVQEYNQGSHYSHQALILSFKRGLLNEGSIFETDEPESDFGAHAHPIDDKCLICMMCEQALVVCHNKEKVIFINSIGSVHIILDQKEPVIYIMDQKLLRQ